ncbi:alpha/beta hydrolase [Pedobacter nutrimenti]|uniref:alpha/beta hydrolase n=1 Tax=Pedobacter nutrimenti TaxID=1241337 RepID=UPI002930CF79|nr:alpha/beta hydrolase-fold protein [Pedobacter nutrimenti]
MKKLLLQILFLFLISSTIYAQEKTQPLTIGITTLLESKELGETRKINIYLPEDYKETDTTKYPVIYILDGGLEEDFIHITGIVRYNTQPWVNRFPKSIVVGIENTNRRRDFTFPVPDLDFLKKIGFKKEQYPQYGGSSLYINFLEKELQPFMDKHYRTSHFNTIVGESLAGLLASEIYANHRNLFNNYMIIAPSLWWGNEVLVTKLKPAADQDSRHMVYIGACNKDEDLVMYQDALNFSKVVQKTAGKNTAVFFDYLPQEIHSTVIHQAVYNAFKLFYPKTEYQK